MLWNQKPLAKQVGGDIIEKKPIYILKQLHHYTPQDNVWKLF
jgi:hypothetical protein